MKSRKVKKSIYWECPRCNMNTNNKGKSMLPCPRGSCEAIVKGVITTTIIKNLILNK